jgi:SAM-dependent methyltransferase
MHRYLQAREIAGGKVVLDIASGEGYGSFILAQKARKVIGVDISAEAVEHARSRYLRENIEFRVGDCADIPLPDASVDLVVSFETIEHHTRHEEMMREVKRVLRPGGAILISSPDKYYYSDVPGFTNEFHVKELYKHEFTELMGRHFRNCRYFGQRVIYGSAIFSESVATPVMSYFRNEVEIEKAAGLAKPMYWIALASDAELPGLASGTMEQPMEDSEITQFWRGQMAERDAQVHELHREVGERDRRIEAYDGEAAALTARLQALLKETEARGAQLAVAQQTLQGIYASNSWRLTAPLRWARRHAISRPSARLRETMARLRKDLSAKGRALWHTAPIAPAWKQRIKALAFSMLPALFRSSKAYRDWKNFTAPSQALEPHAADEVFTVPVLEHLPPTHVPLRTQQAPLVPPVRLIAFYLPQFHAIPENDEWWGKGFTEWTNVTRARPIFEGHYQPRVPGELGYYNLLDSSTQRRQVELAQLYGVGGFCFYYYWFGGKRLLEQPVENYLNDPALDLPFCLCWANENWSRRWDGLDRELLISQKHSPQDDLAFIERISTYLRDPRYIRIDGKPLLLVYRPSQLPAPRETAERWREWCRQNGVGEIYLAYTQSFDNVDPKDFGFDAAVEFPPNNSYPPNVTEGVKPLGGEIDCTIFDWQVFVERSRNYKRPKYPLFRSVCPSWDNTARRKRGGTVFVNNSPARYGEWLRNAIDETCSRTQNPDERLVFVNAWNEWAEGAHLEPDQGYGYAYLQATRDALMERGAVDTERRIVVVVHDAHPHGAQFLALGIVRTLARDFGYMVCTILLGPGRLTGEFEALSTVCRIIDRNAATEDLSAIAREIHRAGYRHAIVNSTASGGFGSYLAAAGLGCVTLVHELPGVIRAHGLQACAQALAETSRCVVFPAQSVADAYAEFASVPADRLRIHPQGLWRRNYWRFRRSAARSDIRRRIGAADAALLVLTVGYADLRKGVDLFVEIGLKILDRRPDAHFIWIGHWDVALQKTVEANVAASGHGAAFHFLGFEASTSVFHAAADVYALTSREDPFPNVVLESFDAGVPAVAFTESGGGAELIRQTGGTTVPLGDTAAFAAAIVEIGANPGLAAKLAQSAMREIDGKYAFRSYLFDILDFLGRVHPRVSVVVPNYNYAHHIVARLQSIADQTVPIFELIILDDASGDGSVDVICAWLEKNNIEARVIVNDRNSGCVTRQWAKGVAEARGEYVWIAEADDLCSPELLKTLLLPVRNEDVVLSYCESRQIDEHGTITAPDYHEYTKDVSKTRWKQAYIRDGSDEIVNALAIKNTIPNVSAVLFRREALAAVLCEKLESIAGYRQAGDWYVYLEVLERGKVAFNPASCNSHRRHAASVVGSVAKSALLEEIAGMQRLAADRHALPERTARNARRYIEELRERFDLRERAAIDK